MALQLVTPPTVEPLTATEAKLHLRVDSTADDALITSLIVAAREYCENKTNRQFINATWKLTLDKFPYACTGTTYNSGYRDSEIRVPRGRLSSVTSIVYLDISGNSTTLSASAYLVDTQSEPGRINPAYLQFWPLTYYVPGAIAVTFVAGYGAAATAVPDGIKSAMRLIIGHLYENREAVNIGSIVNEVPMAVDALLGSYALPEVA